MICERQGGCLPPTWRPSTKVLNKELEQSELAQSNRVVYIQEQCSSNVNSYQVTKLLVSKSVTVTDQAIVIKGESNQKMLLATSSRQRLY